MKNSFIDADTGEVIQHKQYKKYYDQIKAYNNKIGEIVHICKKKEYVQLELFDSNNLKNKKL